ncbi:MAG: YdcF family protein [Actinomycetaceae bacterium]|nr:YdcF family protein [Actinomycetaceae bacterium]
MITKNGLARTAIHGAASALLLFAVAEAASWWAARRFPPHRPGATAIVLGCPANPDGSLSSSQAFRIRILLRSAPAKAVFCGGSVDTVRGQRIAAGGLSEARQMADAARAQGLACDVLLDEGSLTTWENLLAAAPNVEDAQHIMLISVAPHALRARTYLICQRPDLAARLVGAKYHRFGEEPFLKLFHFSYEVGVKIYGAFQALRDR